VACEDAVDVERRIAEDQSGATEIDATHRGGPRAEARRSNARPRACDVAVPRLAAHESTQASLERLCTATRRITLRHLHPTSESAGQLERASHPLDRVPLPLGARDWLPRESLRVQSTQASQSESLLHCDGSCTSSPPPFRRRVIAARRPCPTLIPTCPASQRPVAATRQHRVTSRRSEVHSRWSSPLAPT
jgi:hypothetical protein